MWACGRVPDSVPARHVFNYARARMLARCETVWHTSLARPHDADSDRARRRRMPRSRTRLPIAHHIGAARSSTVEHRARPGAHTGARKSEPPAGATALSALAAHMKFRARAPALKESGSAQLSQFARLLARSTTRQVGIGSERPLAENQNYRRGIVGKTRVRDFSDMRWSLYT